MSSDIINLDALGELLLSEEDLSPEDEDTWTILIVDDDADVHQVTKLALRDVKVDGRGLSFVSAYSGEEAREILRASPTFPLILLDVVMETEDAGLLLVKFIRNELKDSLSRIILRTGQPGTAPEREIIQQYEINDYKAKNELTADRLFTTVTATVRNFLAVSRIEGARKGLESIIDASASVFQLQSLESFAGGILQQLSQILCPEPGDGAPIESALLLSKAKQVKATENVEGSGGFEIIAGLGEYAVATDGTLEAVLGADGLAACLEAVETKSHKLDDDNHSLVYFQNLNTHLVLVIEGKALQDEIGRNLIEAFCGNIAIALSNIRNFERTTLLREAYQRFSSSDAAVFLSKGDITEIELGDCIKVDLSVLVLDIRSFVAMSQQMTTKDVFEFINSYWAYVAPVVEEHHGVVNKYLGDGLMAIFGREGDARDDALRCAQAIQKITREYNDEHRSMHASYSRSEEQRRVPLTVGVGIKTGPTICGTVGCTTRMEFTVMGDTPNLASRYQEATKQFVTCVLTEDVGGSESDYGKLSRKLPRTHIRGSENAVVLWDLFSGDDEGTVRAKLETRDEYHRAVGCLDEGDLIGARDSLWKCLEHYPGDALVAGLIAAIDSNARAFGYL